MFLLFLDLILNFFYFSLVFAFDLIFFLFLEGKECNKETSKGYNTGPYCWLLANCSGSIAEVVETATACDAAKLCLC